MCGHYSNGKPTQPVETCWAKCFLIWTISIPQHMCHYHNRHHHYHYHHNHHNHHHNHRWKWQAIRTTRTWRAHPTHPQDSCLDSRNQREWVFEVREVKSEKIKLSLFFEKCKVKKMLSLFFEKCKVKSKCLHSLSRSIKWNQNASRLRLVFLILATYLGNRGNVTKS